jgi:hypothetical protein
MARTDLLARVDPDLLRLQEAARLRAMYPACFDVKTSQLMLFGILLGLMGDAARLHAIAARRAGASWEELSAVVGLAYLPTCSGACRLPTWAPRSFRRSPRPRAALRPLDRDPRREPAHDRPRPALGGPR